MFSDNYIKLEIDNNKFMRSKSLEIKQKIPLQPMSKKSHKSN
jgi:hypothetical protein